MNASSISSKENEKPSYLMAPKNREYAVRLDLADPNVSEQEPEKITLRSDFSDDIATTGSEKPDFKEDTAVFSRTPFDFSQEVLREDEMSSALRREAENLEGQNTAKQFQEQTAAPEEKIFYEERVEENPEAIEQQPTWGAVMPRAVEDFILRGKKFLRQKKYSLALISFSKAKQKDLEEKYQQEVEFLIEMTKEKLAEISER